MVVIKRENATMAVMLIEAKIDLTLFFEDLYQEMLTLRAIITLRRNIVFPKKCKEFSIVLKTKAKIMIIPTPKILVKPTEKCM